MSAADSDFTKATHGTPYGAISPDRSELSQKGKTILVTGSSSGIGFAIASSFAKANAAKVILTGRGQDALENAVERLSREHPRTTFVSYQVDICDMASIHTLWNQLDKNEEMVHVLVLNACRLQAAGPIMRIGHQAAWTDFVGNVGSHMLFVEKFYNQPQRQEKEKLSLVNVSSAAIHRFDLAAHLPNYSTSKSAGTLLLQQIASDVDASDMQIVSFHPGAIFTSAARNAGYDKTAMNWDDEYLPGNYAVWAASDEAQFLHGRFTWAAWDVEELAGGEKRNSLENNPNLLKIGVVGL